MCCMGIINNQGSLRNIVVQQTLINKRQIICMLIVKLIIPLKNYWRHGDLDSIDQCIKNEWQKGTVI